MLAPRTLVLALVALLAAVQCASAAGNDACMAGVLDDLNRATADAKAQGKPLSGDQLLFHMDAWEACGGVNPFHFTVATGGNLGGRRLMGRSNCGSLSCYRNSITSGSVLCNAWCGLFAICDARPGTWGRCKYVG